MLSVRLNLYGKEHFTWRHGGHIGVPEQWNCGHVGVSNKFCGSLASDQAAQWGKRAGNKQGQIGKISASEARRAVSPDFLFSIFSPFSHNAEPCSRLVGVELFCYLLMKKSSVVPINLHSCWPREWKRTISDSSCAGTRIIYNYPPKGRWIV